MPACADNASIWKRNRILTDSFLGHLRPKKVDARTLDFSVTYGLGGAAALMVIIQFITGLLLGFAYNPSPVLAYRSIEHISNNVFLGALLRNIHHWTGHGLIIVVFLHFLRVFKSKAFYGKRSRNWILGIFLGLLILAANFSGYLLPWDQLSYWAVTVATSLISYIPFVGAVIYEVVRGGEQVGAPTLQLFYYVHTAIIPVFLFVGLSWHFWYVRKAGGVFVEKDCGASVTRVDSNPHLYVRELAFGALLLLFIFLFSALFPAPLGDMADPDVTPSTVKAPWYFMGAQELLLHVPPIVAIVVLPLCILAFLISIPYWSQEDGTGYRKVVRTLFWTGIAMTTLLTTIGVFFRGPSMKLVVPW